MTAMHKLNDTWTIYFYKPDKGKEWKSNLYKVGEIDTIEEFWGVMHHMKPVSNLIYGFDYYLFRSGIEPMWETEANKNGGVWVIPIHKSKRLTHLNEMWLEIQMALVGEILDSDSDEICGAVINVRGNFDSFKIWTRNAANIEANKRIGLKFKALLNHTQNIEYISHYDNANKVGTMTKVTITV